jgi:hypothetical protein
VLTDVLTAVSISWYLRRLKTGYKNSDTLVNKLIAYAVSHTSLHSSSEGHIYNVCECFQVNTGLVTSAVSIACLVTYGTMPENFIFISLYFVLSKRESRPGMAHVISTERARLQCTPTPSWQLLTRGWYSKGEEPTTLTRPFRHSSCSILALSLAFLAAHQTRFTVQAERFAFDRVSGRLLPLL